MVFNKLLILLKLIYSVFLRLQLHKVGVRFMPDYFVKIKNGKGIAIGANFSSNGTVRLYADQGTITIGDNNSYNSPGPKATPYRLNDDGTINSNYDNDDSSNAKTNGISSKEKKKSKTSDFMRKWELNLVRVFVLFFVLYYVLLITFFKYIYIFI